MGRSFENRKSAMAKTASMKTKLYSKYGREIYVIAKSGGTDPTGNLALRHIIERAKKDQVPAHVIEKAVSKAEGGGGEDFTTALYEGYGPGGTMAMVECLTDNLTRTIADVRNCFTRVKCKIGTPGSVAHMFDHSAILAIQGKTEDEVLEAMLEGNVDVTDIEVEEDRILIFAPNTEYFKAKQALSDAFGDVELDVDEIQYLPKTTTKVEGEDLELFNKFLDLLNDLDDVQRVHHNAEF